MERTKVRLFIEKLRCNLIHEYIWVVYCKGTTFRHPIMNDEKAYWVSVHMMCQLVAAAVEV